MIRLVKFLLWFVGVLIVTSLGVVVVVANLVDPNEYKPNIEKVVKTELNRDLAIQGDLSLSFFPWIGVTIHDVSLADREGFGQGPMVSLSQADVRIRLMPLIKGQVEVDTVLLRQPTVMLTINEDGQTNWQDIVEVLGGNNESGSGQSSADDVQQVGAGIAGLVVEGVSIEKGNITFDDKQAGQLTIVSNFDLSTDRLVMGQPLDVELAGDIDTNALPTPLSVMISSTIETNSDFSTLSMENTSISVDSEIHNYELAIPRLDLRLSGGEIDIASFRLSQSDDNLSIADLKVTNFDRISDISVTGDLSLRLEDVDKLLNQLGFSNENISYQIKEVDLGVGFDFSGTKLTLNSMKSEFSLNEQLTQVVLPYLEFDLDKQSLEAPSLILSQDQATFSIDELSGLGIQGPLHDMKLSGDVSFSGTDIGGLLRRSVLNDMSDAQEEDWLDSLDATKSMDVKGQVSLFENNLSLSEIVFNLDELELTGAVVIQSLANPSYEVRLNASELDLDSLTQKLNPAGEEEAAVESAEVAALPIAVLQGLEARANISVDTLIVSGMTLDNLLVEVDSSGDVLTLPVINMDLYEGNIKGNLRYDVSDGVPDLSLNLSGDGLNIGDLLVASGGGDKLTGVATMQSALRGRGRDIDAVFGSLGGEVKMRISDGAIRGVDIQGSLLKVNDVLAAAGESKAVDRPDAETRFADLSGSFDVVNGVFETTDLAMKAPVFRVAGEGVFSIVTNEADMSMAVSVVETLEGQGGKELQDLKGLSIPLLISGPFENLSYRLDLVALAKKSARKELEDALKKKGIDTGQSDENTDGVNVEQLLEDPEEAIKQELKKKLTNKLLKSLGG